MCWYLSACDKGGPETECKMGSIQKLCLTTSVCIYVCKV